MSGAESAEKVARPGAGTVVRLPDGHVACADCGRSVPTPDLSLVTWLDPVAVASDPPGHVRVAIEPVPVAYCPLCRLWVDRSAGLVGRFPELRRRWGEGADHVVHHALVGLGLLQDRRSVTGDLTADEVMLIADRLARPGASCRFSQLLAPVAYVGGGWCSASPWGHLGLDPAREAWVGLRRGYASVLAADVARSAPPAAPERVACPPVPRLDGAPPGSVIAVGRGCMLCGVDAVTLPAGATADIVGPPDRRVRKIKVGSASIEEAMARQARAARGESTSQVIASSSPLDRSPAPRPPTWKYRENRPAALGLLGVSGLVAGWTCSRCNEAVDPLPGMDFGSPRPGLSPAGAELALVSYLNVGRGAFDPDRDYLDGVIAWGAYFVRSAVKGRPLPAPNSEPWQHLGSPDDLRQELAFPAPAPADAAAAGDR